MGDMMSGRSSQRSTIGPISVPSDRINIDQINDLLGDDTIYVRELYQRLPSENTLNNIPTPGDTLFNRSTLRQERGRILRYGHIMDDIVNDEDDIPELENISEPEDIPDIVNDEDDIPELEDISEPEDNKSSPTKRELEHFKNSYNELINRLYNIPSELPNKLYAHGIMVPIITYKEAAEKITNGHIIKFDINPLHQPYSGPPNNPNRMITIFDKSGNSYVVKAVYNKNTHQISCPK